MSSIVTSEASRKAYAERKSQVLDLLLSAKEYYLKNDRQDKADVFDVLYNDLLNGEFSIVIVGEFSAGKSTLLNALMGERLLPSFSNETTATVNFLRHSDKSESGEGGRVFYNNGEQESLKDITLETIEHFVSTKGNEVAKKVDHLDLYLDSEFLKDGVTLVDSPGLNGVADGHREITEAQILKSHASIFLFNSDHPGSKTDFEFLHDLQSRVKTIIFVLNKIDEIKADEGESPESVIETLKKTYKEKFPDEKSVPEIWPVAAYPALVARNAEPLEYHDKKNRTIEERKELEESSRLKKFEDRLLSFLTCGEKTKHQLLSPVERILALTQETRKEYYEEIQLLENATDTSEIDNQIAGIKESIEAIQSQMTNSKKEIAKNIKEVSRDIQEDLKAEMERLQRKKTNEIDICNDLEDLREYLASFEETFKGSVSKIALTQAGNLREKILDVAELQYVSQAEIIEQNLLNNQVEVNLAVSTHLDTSEKVFEVGLKEMNEKVNVLEEQLEKLQEEANSAKEDYYKQRSLERKQKKLEDEMKSLQDRKDIIEMQTLPAIERYTEVIHTEENRGGLFGLVGNILFGPKKVTRHGERTDSTAHDEAKEKLDNARKDINNAIEQMQKEVNAIRNADSTLAEWKQIQKSAEADAIRKKLESVIKENKEKINARYNKEVKRTKKTLSDYCDTISNELNLQVKNALRSYERSYIEVVANAVEGSLRQALIDKETRLEQLEKQLQSSEADRNERIETLKEKVENINELIGRAADIQIEIDSIPVDIIQQQQI